MSVRTFTIAGIELDVWSTSTNPPPLPPSSGLPRLPVTVLFILHGRNNTRNGIANIANRMLQLNAATLEEEERTWKRELIVVTFDHRNHGSRLVDANANNGWNLKDNTKHNPRHALDMYALQVGSALDVTTLIEFLPSYLYPDNERKIDQWALAGFSLGGHSTWIAAKNDPRIEVVVPIVGCPDYIPLMYDRASRRGIDASDPAHFPPSLVAYIRSHDPASSAFKLTDASNPFWGKKILAMAGGKDPLVPWTFSRAFFDALEVGDRGVKECFIDPDAKHEWTDAMGEVMAAFIKQHCLLYSRL